MTENKFTFQRSLDGLLLAKQAEGKSPNTLKWYRYQLTNFNSWVKRIAQSDLLSDITPEQIREYLKYLREEHVPFSNHPLKRNKLIAGCSQRMVLGAFATLSTFFNWAVVEGLINRSPTANIKRPKVAKTITPVFSKDEMTTLLKACEEGDDEAIIARNKAILMVLLDTGVRISELLDMRINRINLNESSAQVHGKGSKDRNIYFGAQSKKALWRYISLFRPQPMGVVNNVFLNHDGTALQSRRVAHILKKLGKKAGVDNVHPHRFRHTAAVQFLRNGGNLFALQKMLGHTTLDMVRYYVELSQEDVKNVHKTASPADNWGLG